MGEDGNDVKEGEPGELWVRGPNIMKVLCDFVVAFATLTLVLRGTSASQKQRRTQSQRTGGSRLETLWS